MAFKWLILISIDDDQNLVSLVNTLGPGASIVFEHVDPGGDKESFSNLALKVDF